MSTITVSNVVGLKAALIAARSGDTIYLDSGTYSGVAIKNIDIPGNVTITSRDPGIPAVLTDLNVNGSSGLTFTNLEFAANEGGHFAYQVSGSQNIVFSNLNVHGSLNGNPDGDSSGIAVRQSSNVRIEKSEFHELGHGVTVSGSDGVVVENNRFHDVRTDGMTVSDTINIKILGNSFTNFWPVAGDHPDAIQFLTRGTMKASENIEISGNVISRGDGGALQGIFMTDQVGTLAYKNVTISGNLLVGTGYHGVTLMHGENITIAGNELISYLGKTNVNWVLVQNANGVAVTDNSAVKFSFDNVTGLVQAGNETTLAVSDFGEAALKAWIESGGKPSAPQPPVIELPTDGGIVQPPEGGEIDQPPVDGAGPPTSPVPPPADGGSVITGSMGDDHLLGTGGDDTIADGYGADVMAGGLGNDTYYIHNPGKIEADLVIEHAGEGVDTVISSASYVLADNLENLVLTGKGGTTGRGNELDNKVLGNSGRNIVDGGAGNDTIDGGAGDDTMIGREGDDVIAGGLGNDTFWFDKFKVGGGKDTVVDFGARGEHDQIDISAYLKAGFKPVLTDVGDDLLISFKNGDEITLIGVHSHDLTATSTGFII